MHTRLPVLVTLLLLLAPPASAQSAADHEALQQRIAELEQKLAERGG